MNKKIKIYLFLTVALFTLGSLLMIIGMEAKSSYDLLSEDYDYSYKMSISYLMSVFKFMSVDSNLFDAQNIISMQYSQIMNSTSGMSGDLFAMTSFLKGLLDLANTAIAGFSFIIISIFAALLTAATVLKDYLESKK